MKNLNVVLVETMNEQFKADLRQKGIIHDDLEKRLQRHKKFEVLRADWAEKRVNSIFREVVRYEIKVTSIKGNLMKATFQTVTMEGTLEYQQMREIRAYKHWKRPKIIATFWVLDSNGDRCYLERGHCSAAFKVIFGEKRMMTYNRLMPAFMDAIAR